jgi:plastocyanin
MMVAALILLAACSQGEPPKGTVELIPGRRFNPKEVTITVGETITWIGKSEDLHTVTAYDDSIPTGADYFASGGASSEQGARENISDGLIGDGDTFKVTFTTPGTYEYFCIPHESDGMKGTIVVEQEGVRGNQ